MRANRGRSGALARRLAGAFLAVAMLAVLAPGAGADTKSDLEAAKQRLAEVEQEIDDQQSRLATLQAQAAQQHARLDALQGELNELAAQISDAQGRLEQTQAEVSTTRARLAAAQRRYEALQSRLADRARASYEDGPGGSIEVILGSTTIRELSDRIEFVNQISRSDLELANDVQNRANELKARRDDLQKLESRQAGQIRELQSQQRALNAKFAEQKQIYDSLAAQSAEAAQIARNLESNQAEVASLIGQLQKKLDAEELAAALAAKKKAEEARKQAQEDAQQNDSGSTDGDDSGDSGGGDSGGGDSGGGDSGGGDSGGGDSGGGSSGANPLAVCPVPGAGYYDGFGAPRYAGGYHPHAGIDMVAARGTPIQAPFAGTFRRDYNGLGGNSFFLSGSLGYVYGAHLDSYSSVTGGSVSAGTVIGYVGDTGDARGGITHLHFEWHPSVIPPNPYRSQYGYTVIGSAIDPFPFLNAVC